MEKKKKKERMKKKTKSNICYIPETPSLTHSNLFSDPSECNAIEQYLIQTIDEKIAAVSLTNNNNNNNNNSDNNPYQIANELIQGLVEEYKSNIKCPFKYVYGAVLGGSVQKNLAVGKKFDADLVFLFKVPSNIRTHLSKIYQRQQEIFSYIKQFIRKKSKEMGEIRGKEFQVLNNPQYKTLQIIFENLEFDILVAFSYEYRQYCSFHYKDIGKHVYPFSMDELTIAAKDLIHLSDKYKSDIEWASQIKSPKEEIEFLKRNMSASLTLLSTYYMRDELVGKNTRRAVLFLKAWKKLVLENSNKIHLYKMPKSITMEMLCVDAWSRWKSIKKTCNDITVLDILLQVFDTLILFGDYERANRKTCVAAWPLQENKEQTLVVKKEIDRFLDDSHLLSVMIMDNIILQNVERDFTQWSLLAEYAKVIQHDLMNDESSAREAINRVRDVLKNDGDNNSDVSSISWEDICPGNILALIVEYYFYEAYTKNPQQRHLSIGTIVTKWKKVYQEYGLQEELYYVASDFERELKILKNHGIVRKEKIEKKKLYVYVGTPTNTMIDLFKRFRQFQLQRRSN